MRDVHIDALGEQGIVLYLGAKRIERDFVHVLDDKHEVRVADIHCARPFEHVPAERHVARVHRIGERNVLPLEAGVAHRRFSHVRTGTDMEDAASGLDTRRFPMEHGHRAGRITAGLYLATVGIVDAHCHVRVLRRPEHDQLVEPDAAMAVCDRAPLRRIEARQFALATGVHGRVG